MCYSNGLCKYLHVLAKATCRQVHPILVPLVQRILRVSVRFIVFTADLLNTPCRPRIDNLVSCGLCDVTALTDNVTENQFGDEFITFPLLCECFVMTDCPDTCNFTSGPANPSSSAYENHGLWCTVTTMFGIFSLIATFL